MKRMICVIAVIMLLCSVALAEADIYISATVVNVNPIQINATYGGKVSDVLSLTGDHVDEGDAIAVLSGTKVYALQDGTAHLFAAAGDSAEAAVEVYGAVAYIEPASIYSLTGSTKNVYEGEENKIIHPGEKVYIRSISNTVHKGEGYVTNVSGTSYGVEITQGTFTSSETVYIYRNADFLASSRIGSGSISRKDPVAYTAEGIVSRIFVAEGEYVKKGDALFETLSGVFDGKDASPYEIVSPVSGVLTGVALTRGIDIAAGDAVAVLYPDEDMRIEAKVSESDLQYFAVDAEVKIELINLGDGSTTISGRIERISRFGSADDSLAGDMLFSLMIIPDETDGLSYGLTALVSLAQ